MHLDAELDIADALDLDAAVTAGAAHRAALGSTESLDVRRAQAVGDLARHQLALDLNPDLNADRNADQEGTHSSARVKPRQVVLYVHLSEAAVHDSSVDPVARLERGDALVTADQVRTWCGHPDAQVVVKPVIDLNDCVATDSDDVPDRIAEHVVGPRPHLRLPLVHPPAHAPATATTSSPAPAAVRPAPATSPRCADDTTG